MRLHRIHLNPRSREARRDLADPYELHSSLTRAFSATAVRCAPGTVLWRLEPETDAMGNPRIIIQSDAPVDWDRIVSRDWLASSDSPVDLQARLKLAELSVGRRFRFRLRANPCVTRNKKRLGLMHLAEQESWLVRKGALHGFSLPELEDWAGASASEEALMRPDVRISQAQMLRGQQHDSNEIRIYSVLYDGLLSVVDPPAFVDALRSGIGHGKALGLGLLSIAPTN